MQEKWLQVPTTEKEFMVLASDKMWRLHNLYYITNEHAVKTKFRPREAQLKFLLNRHGFDIILKARQLGFSTVVQLDMLDDCLFGRDENAAIIAQSMNDAEEIFSTKLKFPYDNLPEFLKKEVYPIRDSRTAIEFNNGSKIRVGVSMRSSTLTNLHISEHGKICAKDPLRAKEIRTGSLNAVHEGQKITIESTAEGREGDFFEFTQRAKALEGKELNPLDFKFHFYPWYQNTSYTLKQDVIVSKEHTEYFDKLEGELKTKLTKGQRAWYVKKWEVQQDDMKREFPSCVASGELVSTPSGLVPIEGVNPDGLEVLAYHDKGIQPVFKLTTALGYQVVCTDNHPIKCIDGKFTKLIDLMVGDSVMLGVPNFGAQVQTVKYNPVGFVESSIEISESFALFLGIFMGDGSFHKNCVSIACDRKDDDTIKVASGLMHKFLGGSNPRVLGSKQGCIELRVSNIRFEQPFLALGLLRQNGSQNWKRRVWVPDYIKKSPQPVVKEFLRGLFEADGFAQRNGTGVKFFTKHESFARDIQLLLLQFGITCKHSRHDKKAGNGTIYEGHEISLRTEESRIFCEKIGFISERKNKRILDCPPIKAPYACRRKQIIMNDMVVSIQPYGNSQVHDLTTASHEFIAGGIVVHNCPDEAFEQAIDGAYFAQQMALARKQNRIGNVPFDPSIPVNTFWDIGLRDSTSIWFHQRVGLENRFIHYYENSGEQFPHYAKYLQDMDCIYGGHYLPHDANKGDIRAPGSLITDANELLKGEVYLVPRVKDKKLGIAAVRATLGSCWIDKGQCDQGIKHLDNYRKEWNENLGCWRDEPRHDAASHGADAFMQFAQSYRPEDSNSIHVDTDYDDDWDNGDISQAGS